MPDATQVGEARAAQIISVALGGDTQGYLQHVEGRGDYEADDARGVVRFSIMFLLRDADGKHLLTPPRRGENEAYILVEETRRAPDWQVTVYNYDVVFPSHRGYHFGFHHHMHNNRLYPHRQGFGVPRGHEAYSLVDLERDGIFWDLVSKAFEIDYAVNQSGAERASE